ncbi:hypothetical protein [Pseudoruegeria sp. HB172150]|uniref:hypothetical protein n=1 Tax=Pseudoruegeria sp. HB172150 TaxID=2721164 RepID=UPI0015558A5C|nr:hypothetical protein [Pseudoruegeria sp. HB172150]
MTVSTAHRRMVPLLLFAWAIAYLGSFLAFYVTPENDFGFTAGWNRIGVFVVWQFVATVMAALTAVFSRSLPRRDPMRNLALLPIGVLGLSAASLATLFIWVSLSQPAAGPAPDLTPAPVASTQSAVG